MPVTSVARRTGGWFWMAIFGAIQSAVFAQAAERMRFFEQHPELQFVEQRLPRAATVVIPPESDAGRHVATDVELGAAFVRVLDEFLAPPSTFAPKAGQLIGGICQYRPAQAARWAELAAGRILAHSLPGAEKQLAEAVAGAVAVNPAQAPEVASRTIGAIIQSAEMRDISAEAACRMGGGAVAAAMNAVAAGPDAAAILGAISEESLRAALERDAGYLVVELMAASVAAGQDRKAIGELCQVAFTRFARTKELTGLIAVGAMKGSDPSVVNVIKDQAALSLPVPFAAYAVVVCNAYGAVLTAPEAAPQIPRLLPVTAADYVPAVMIGAVGARPDDAVEILRAGLDRDRVMHGRATTREIVEAALLACGGKAKELAAAAVGHGDPSEGNAAAQIAEAVARSAPPASLLAALAGQIEAEKMNAENAKAVAGGAIAGAVAGNRLPMLGAITLTIASRSHFSAEVLDQTVTAAPPELQHAAALGAIAADREHGAALLERAAQHHDLQSAQAALLAAGGGLVVEIQRNPAGFFHEAAKRLLAPQNASGEAARAIVLGAALANPRGAPAVAAAAAVAPDAELRTLIATASQGDRAAELTIAEAVAAARQATRAPGELVNYVRERLATDPASAPALATGGAAAAPELADVIGSVAAAEVPGAIDRIVPRLFAFSSTRNPLAAHAEPLPAVLAELTAGVMRGALASPRDAESEDRAVGEVTAAVVKSSLALTLDPALAPSRDVVLAAVVRAATREAGAHSLAIARVAARVTRSLLREEADGAKLRAAVLAAHPAESAGRIADAIAAGFSEADAQIPAPNARALLDYAHDPLTGTPMTRYRDL